MSIDIDIIKARAKNEYRLSKVRGEAMISVRIPGGILPAHLLTVARDIAETWGNGQIHLTTRQKLAMPGIRYEDIDNVNAALEPFLREIEIELCDVQVEDTKAGYLAIGGRNIVACQGNRICQKANTDTTGLSRRLEKLVYPSPYHLNTVIVGCPNDCAKASMADLGIIGVAKMRFTADRCIGCGACVKACSHHAVGCLALKNGKAVKEESACIGCGECVLACPTLAWQRKPDQLWQVRLGGRTSKKTPRVGKLFLNWVTEDVIKQVIVNLYEFEKEMLGGKPIYLHMGHLIDKGGYLRFKERVLRGVQLNPEAMVAERIYWAEDESVARMHLKPADTNQPRHGRSPPTGCGTLNHMTSAATSSITPPASASVDQPTCRHNAGALFPLSFTARSRKVCTSSASEVIVSEVPAAIASTDAIPQLKTPITLLNNSTIIAPEQGRIPIDSTIMSRARQSSPLCNCSCVGRC